MKGIIQFLIWTLLTCIFLQLHSTSAYAQETLILTDSQEKYPLGLYLKYFEDPTGELTIDDVASAKCENQFILSDTRVPGMGLSNSAYWVQVHLQNENNVPTDWRLVVQQPHLDFIDLYLPQNDGHFEVKQAGDQVPFDAREVEHRQVVFKITMPSMSERIVYLRVQSTGPILFDFTLWTPDAFSTYTSHYQLLLGSLLGVLCIMGAYNLFLYRALGDRTYLYYVLFILFAMMTMGTVDYGLSYQYLWPDWMLLNQIGSILFPSLTMLTALIFAMAFLQTKKYTPTLHRYLLGFQIPYLLCAILSVFNQSNWIAALMATLAIPGIFLIMIAGILAWRKGYQPARYYILAWTMLWLNGIALSIHVLGLMTIPEHPQFALFTVTAMVLFLSLALADRINILKQKTEQAKTETDNVNRQLKGHQIRLARSEKKYRSLFVESNDTIFMTDLEGLVEEINPAGEILMGYAREEAVGENVIEAYANVDDRARFRGLMLQKGMIRDFEVKLRRKDGKEIDTVVSASLRHAEEGEVVGFQGIIRDITSSKQAEAERSRALELQTAKEVAESANRAKSVFLANMSHELRTPLNAILGFAQVMTRSQTIHSDDHEHLRIIIRNSEYLLTLINQVLDLSKIEAGHITLNVRNFDLLQLLSDMEDIFSMKASRKALQLVLECGEDVPHHIRTDEIKLRQVFMNVLNNAIKFTEKGTLIFKISLIKGDENSENSKDASHQTDENHIQFEIEDTGLGIEPDEIDQVFKVFGQTSAGRQAQEGTGLGLPISRKFVQLMGGDMQIKSKVGHGTRFTFDIRCAAIASNIPMEGYHNHQKNMVKRVVGLEAGQPIYRILIVDDVQDNRQLLVKLLSPFGFELKEAKDGQEAIDVWKTFEPHLIWLDIRMPVLDGFEVTRRIKASTKRMETVIIAITASSNEDEHAVMLKSGCDDYLRKPFRAGELFNLISKHLDVKFVYEEEISPAEKRPLLTKEVRTSEALASLPAEWRDNLKQGAHRADFTLLTKVIEQIREHHETLACELKHLVDDYEYDEILALFHPTGEEDLNEH